MVLAITFKDGSNPYYYRPRDGDGGRAICKEFYKWKRAGYFPKNYFRIVSNGFVIEHDYNGIWFIRHNNKVKIYKHLGNAINATIKNKGW